MKNIKIVIFVAVLAAMVVTIAPNFSFALSTPVDPGDSAGSGDSDLPAAQDPGDSAGANNSGLPEAQDPGDSAGAGNYNLPPAQDPGTSADTGSGLPPTQDPGDSAGPGNGGTPSGSSGGRGNNSTSGGTRTTLEISNVKITPVGSSIPVSVITGGFTYTISWSSNRGINTALFFIPAGLGENIAVGSSSTNTLNWTVPTSVKTGNYTLYFTDTAINQVASHTAVYRIEAPVRAPSSSAERANQATPDSNGGAIVEEPVTDENAQVDQEGADSEFPLVEDEEETEIDPSLQAASVGSLLKDFIGSKYLLWLAIVLLVVAGILAFIENKDRGSGTLK